MPGLGGIAVAQRGGAFAQHLGEFVQQLFDVVAGFPARVLRDQDRHEQGEHAAHDRVDAAGERAPGRRREQHHQQGLQPQLRGENRAAVEEPCQQDREQQHDGGLPHPGAQPVQQQVPDHNADGAAQADLDHAAQPGVPGKAQGDEGGRGGEKRPAVAQHVLRERVGADGAAGHLDGRHEGVPAPDQTGADAAAQEPGACGKSR